MRKNTKNQDQLELFNIQTFTRYPNILTRSDVGDVVKEISNRMGEIEEDIEALNEEEAILVLHKHSA
jgi:hypothetical protein